MEGSLHELATELPVERGGLARVSADVLDADPLDDPVRPGLHGERRERAQDGHRNARLLDLLADRCPATIAGASRGHQHSASGPLGGEGGRDLHAVPTAVEEALVIARGHAVEVEQLGEHSLALELACDVERQH